MHYISAPLSLQFCFFFFKTFGKSSSDGSVRHMFMAYDYAHADQGLHSTIFLFELTDSFNFSQLNFLLINCPPC